ANRSPMRLSASTHSVTAVLRTFALTFVLPLRLWILLIDGNQRRRVDRVGDRVLADETEVRRRLGGLDDRPHLALPGRSDPAAVEAGANLVGRHGLQLIAGPHESRDIGRRRRRDRDALLAARTERPGRGESRA